MLPYPEEKFAPCKDPIPLMAVFQQNTYQVHPVLDFLELNGHNNAYLAHVDICVQKLK